MPRYIDVENYCENVCRCDAPHCDKSKCPIFNATPADVAPVVRCKDCKYHAVTKDTGRHYCKEPLGCFGCIPITPDDYCSRAVKMDLEDDG